MSTTIARHRGSDTGERRLLSPLLAWLNRLRRIGPGSVVVEEFSWCGRWVDLATMTSTGRTTAYELKDGSTGRAIEQALYNSASFDRSFIVLAATPRSRTLEEAMAFGIGVIVIERSDVRLLHSAPLIQQPPRVKRMLSQALIGGRNHRVC